MDINYRLISSHLFFINVFVNYIYEDYIYCFLFCNLLISSILLHWLQFYFIYLKQEILNLKYLDKLNITMVVIYGFYTFIKKTLKKKINYWLLFIILTTFFYCILVWNIGYILKKFCFDKDEIISAKFHSSMHFIGSLGHLLICII